MGNTEQHVVIQLKKDSEWKLSYAKGFFIFLEEAVEGKLQFFFPIPYWVRGALVIWNGEYLILMIDICYNMNFCMDGLIEDFFFKLVNLLLLSSRPLCFF